MRQRNSQVDLTGKINQLLLDAQEDGVESGRARFGKFNEPYQLIINPDNSTEGTYFTTSQNVSLQALPSVTAYTATFPHIDVYNSEHYDRPTLIILDHITLTVGATAPATDIGTGILGPIYFAIVLDEFRKGSNLTGQSTLLTQQIANPHGLYSPRSIAKPVTWNSNGFIGAATGAARMIVGQRLLFRPLAGTTLTLGDAAVLKFGAANNIRNQLTTAEAAPRIAIVHALPKAIVPPNWSLLLHTWVTGGGTPTLPTCRIEIGWWER